jgi:hypothetical protein
VAVFFRARSIGATAARTLYRRHALRVFFERWERWYERQATMQLILAFWQHHRMRASFLKWRRIYGPYRFALINNVARTSRKLWKSASSLRASLLQRETSRLFACLAFGRRKRLAYQPCLPGLCAGLPEDNRDDSSSERPTFLARHRQALMRAKREQRAARAIQEWWRQQWELERLEKQAANQAVAPTLVSTATARLITTASGAASEPEQAGSVSVSTMRSCVTGSEASCASPAQTSVSSKLRRESSDLRRMKKEVEGVRSALMGDVDLSNAALEQATQPLVRRTSASSASKSPLRLSPGSKSQSEKVLNMLGVAGRAEGGSVKSLEVIGDAPPATVPSSSSPSKTWSPTRRSQSEKAFKRFGVTGGAEEGSLKALKLLGEDPPVSPLSGHTLPSKALTLSPVALSRGSSDKALKLLGLPPVSRTPSRKRELVEGGAAPEESKPGASPAALPPQTLSPLPSDTGPNTEMAHVMELAHEPDTLPVLEPAPSTATLPPLSEIWAAASSKLETEPLVENEPLDDEVVNTTMIAPSGQAELVPPELEAGSAPPVVEPLREESASMATAEEEPPLQPQEDPVAPDEGPAVAAAVEAAGAAASPRSMSVLTDDFCVVEASEGKVEIPPPLTAEAIPKVQSPSQSKIEEDVAAAVAIQRAWRGHHVRRSLPPAHHKEHQRFRQELDAVLDDEQGLAARRIQSRWRGHRARKGMGKKRHSRRHAGSKEDRAAVTIQKRWRGHRTRCKKRRRKEVNGTASKVSIPLEAEREPEAGPEVGEAEGATSAMPVSQPASPAASVGSRSAASPSAAEQQKQHEALSALLLAVKKGDTQAMEAALSQGADVNGRTVCERPLQ